jgi:hypothetical protein
MTNGTKFTEREITNATNELFAQVMPRGVLITDVELHKGYASLTVSASGLAGTKNGESIRNKTTVLLSADTNHIGVVPNSSARLYKDYIFITGERTIDTLRLFVETIAEQARAAKQTQEQTVKLSKAAERNSFPPYKCAVDSPRGRATESARKEYLNKQRKVIFG